MSETNELAKVINESGVEQSTALTLQNSFLPFFERAREWKEKAESLVVTDASQLREMKMAREARLALRDIRIEADKTRKALKEDSIRYGKAVQGVYNVIEYLIVPIEKHLEDQEKFAERLEEKRIAALHEERLEALRPYMEFVPYALNYGTLTEEAWLKVYNGAKMQHEAKIEAERKAEQERIEREKAEAAERERVRQENERLRKEAEEAEKKRKEAEEKARKEREEAERKLAEQKRLAYEAARKEKEKAEAALAEERRKAAEKLAIEQAAAKKLADELKAKQEAEELERKRKAAEEQARIDAEKKAAKAPDKTKLLAWVDAMQVTPPVCSTLDGVKVSETVRDKFTAFKSWAKLQIETL